MEKYWYFYKDPDYSKNEKNLTFVIQLEEAFGELKFLPDENS